MDLMTGIRDLFIQLAYRLPEGLTCYILRMGILLALDAVLLFLSLTYMPLRSVFSQVCVAFLGLVIALYFPVEEFRVAGEGFLAFCVVVALLCMVFIPNFLPSLLTPKAGDQAKLKKILIYVIWGFFFFQILMWR